MTIFSAIKKKLSLCLMNFDGFFFKITAQNRTIFGKKVWAVHFFSKKKKKTYKPFKFGRPEFLYIVYLSWDPAKCRGNPLFLNMFILSDRILTLLLKYCLFSFDNAYYSSDIFILWLINNYELINKFYSS